MRVAIIKIRSVKLHTPETLCPYTDGGSVYRADDDTTTTTGDKTIIYPVSIRFFDAPAPDPLNDEAFRAMAVHTMSETPGCLLSLLT